MKVLILGAGASHGHGLAGQSPPPMAKEFLDANVRRMLSPDYDILWDYMRDVLRISLDDANERDIESAYSRLESTWELRAHGDPDKVGELFGNELRAMSPPKRLYCFIIDTVYALTSWLASHSCPLHDYLSTSWLRSGDVVVSFNYDLIMDNSLVRSGRWVEWSGYGFPAHIEQPRNMSAEIRESEITLLKPHGSLNWYKGKDYTSVGSQMQERDVLRVVPVRNAMLGILGDRKIEIPPRACRPGLWDVERMLKPGVVLGPLERRILYDQWSNIDLAGQGILPYIIVPTPYKPFAEMRFAELASVWSQIGEAISRADSVYIAGFSFRDSHFNQLMLERTYHRGQALNVYVVDPRREARDICSRMLSGNGIQVEEVPPATFEAWVHSLSS
jgi:hypothetical protein